MLETFLVALPENKAFLIWYSEHVAEIVPEFSSALSNIDTSTNRDHQFSDALLLFRANGDQLSTKLINIVGRPIHTSFS